MDDRTCERDGVAVPARRRPLARLLGVAVALAALLVPAGPALAADDVPAPAPPAEPTGAVVLVGVTGLQWSDVRTLATPNLWDLTRRSGVGTVAARSARGTSCPADGWLAVNAGARWADLEADDRTCRTLRDIGADAPVPGWDDYVAAAREQPYGARPGLLGERLAAEGVAPVGIGPGAAIALADPTGVPVGTHVTRSSVVSELRRAVDDALDAGTQLVVVDAGQVREPGHATRSRPAGGDEPATPEETPDEGLELPPTSPEPSGPDGVEAIAEPTRLEQVRVVDERVGAVLRATQQHDVTVLLVSLADSGPPRLQLAAATGPAPRGGRYDGSLLTSGTTRQPGVVQATDVTVTLLDALGLAVPDAAVGAPLVPTAGPGTATARADLMHDIAAEALHVTRVSGPFLTRLVYAAVALFLAAGVLLRSVRPARRGVQRLVMRVVRVAALAIGALPIASFLTGLVPWWRAPVPATAFWWTLVGWSALVTAVALLGPWRRRLLGPAAVVAGVTVVALVVDALVGSPLVIDSPMGAHRLMAARFYGMSNQAFALLAAAGPILATALAQELLDRGRRGLAVATVAGIGVVLAVVNGAPGLGSDFGGPPGLIVGFAVLAILVSGRKVRWRTLLLVLGVAAVVVVAFAALDWLRDPADRTHLGRFFATVLDGGLWDVVARKLSVHLRVLTYWRYLVLAIGGAIVTLLVLAGSRTREDGSREGPMVGVWAAVPLLRPCVAAVAIALGIGFVINDSGIIIPATGMALAVPCLVAAAAQRRLDEGSPPDAEVTAGEAEAARDAVGR